MWKPGNNLKFVRKNIQMIYRYFKKLLFEIWIDYSKLKFRCYKNYLVWSAARQLSKFRKKSWKSEIIFADRSESKAKFRKSQSTFNSATKKGGKMESSSSSPETPEILRDVSHQENLEEQCQELLKSSENREGKYFLRNNCILISNFFFFSEYLLI